MINTIVAILSIVWMKTLLLDILFNFSKRLVFTVIVVKLLSQLFRSLGIHQSRKLLLDGGCSSIITSLPSFSCNLFSSHFSTVSSCSVDQAFYSAVNLIVGWKTLSIRIKFLKKSFPSIQIKNNHQYISTMCVAAVQYFLKFFP